MKKKDARIFELHVLQNKRKIKLETFEVLKPEKHVNRTEKSITH